MDVTHSYRCHIQVLHWEMFNVLNEKRHCSMDNKWHATCCCYPYVCDDTLRFFPFFFLLFCLLWNNKEFNFIQILIRHIFRWFVQRVDQGILVDFASSNQCGLAPGFQSLYSILQATKTKMGGRTLRANLMEPLIGRDYRRTSIVRWSFVCNDEDANSIHYRQDAVENLIDDEKFMFQIQTILLHFTDVERKSNNRQSTMFE
jgi:hypothetical protein